MVAELPAAHRTLAANHDHSSVVIVGAGLAGLLAARCLRPHFPDLLVVEASSSAGGRVKQVGGLAEWPVEAGPEFVHGGNALLQGLLAEMGCELRELAWPDQWWWKGNESSKSSFQTARTPDAELERLHCAFENIGQEQLPSPDISVKEWLCMKGVTARAQAAADACYANDFGCGLAQLGLREVIAENRAWDAGESYFILDRSLSQLADHLARPLGTALRCNWPVKRLTWHADSSSSSSSPGAAVTLFGPDQHILTCDRVLVTVPLLALQSSAIKFEPPLPRRKMEAIQRLRMGAAVKLLLGFTTAVWPTGFWNAICPAAFLPEVWVTSYPAAATTPGRHTAPAAPGAAFASWVTAQQVADATAKEAGIDPVTSPSPTAGTAHASSNISAASSNNINRKKMAAKTPGAKPARQEVSGIQVAACVVTGFATGPAAEAIAALPPAVAVCRALRQLDDMFGKSAQSCPASAAFLMAAVVDWAAQPFIGGGYTYPTLGAEVGDRDALAAPTAGVLYWAGEATHPAVNPCMQAALETGQTAAQQIIAAAKPPRSAL